MKADYRLIGLTLSKSGTIEPLGTDAQAFTVSFDIPDDRFQALFNWAKSVDDFWEQAMIAEVEYDKLSTNNEPINARVIGVREWDLPYAPFPQWKYNKSGRRYPDWRERQLQNK